jgi:hypothetical protein
MDNPKITEKQPKSWIYRSDYSIFEFLNKVQLGTRMDNPKITEKQPKSWIYRSDYSIFESDFLEK